MQKRLSKAVLVIETEATNLTDDFERAVPLEGLDGRRDENDGAGACHDTLRQLQDLQWSDEGGAQVGKVAAGRARDSSRTSSMGASDCADTAAASFCGSCKAQAKSATVQEAVRPHNGGGPRSVMDREKPTAPGDEGVPGAMMIAYARECHTGGLADACGAMDGEGIQCGGSATKAAADDGGQMEAVTTRERGGNAEEGGAAGVVGTAVSEERTRKVALALAAFQARWRQVEVNARPSAAAAARARHR